MVARAPSRLHAHLVSQRTLCDQLLAQKDEVVRSLEAELRCMDDEYNLEVTTHGQVRTGIAATTDGPSGWDGREKTDVAASLAENILDRWIVCL